MRKGGDRNMADVSQADSYDELTLERVIRKAEAKMQTDGYLTSEVTLRDFVARAEKPGSWTELLQRYAPTQR